MSLRDPIDQQKLDKLLEDTTNRVLAVKHEGPDWEDFEEFFFVIETAQSRMEQLLRKGYKIFIVPTEGRLYDAISNTVHHFDRNGRGEIISAWM